MNMLFGSVSLFSNRRSMRCIFMIGPYVIFELQIDNPEIYSVQSMGTHQDAVIYMYTQAGVVMIQLNTRLTSIFR